MTAYFQYPNIYLSSSSEVYKSEDGEIYNLFYNGGDFIDSDLCIPTDEETNNYYFYSGDGEILCIGVKMP
jgi:hypothetical protein